MEDIAICNLYEEDPLAPNKFDAFDAIVAPQCLGALRSLQHARKAVKNLAMKYLKPGGYFITVGVFANVPYYVVGKEKFEWSVCWSPPHSVDNLRKMHEYAGLDIKGVYPFVEGDPAAEYIVLVTVIAQKS